MSGKYVNRYALHASGSRQQLIQPPVSPEGLLFDIVRNVDPSF